MKDRKGLGKVRFVERQKWSIGKVGKKGFRESEGQKKSREGWEIRD